jgi:hypothetical protein
LHNPKIELLQAFGAVLFMRVGGYSSRKMGIGEGIFRFSLYDVVFLCYNITATQK